MKRAMLVAMVLLSGCAHVEKIKTPDNQDAYLIKCHASHVELCFDKASEICPKGYKILASGGYGGGAAVAEPVGNGMVVATSPGHSQFIVQCK